MMDGKWVVGHSHNIRKANKLNCQESTNIDSRKDVGNYTAACPMQSPFVDVFPRGLSEATTVISTSEHHCT